MDPLRAVFLNCTLKRSPADSNTGALIDKVIGFMKPLGVRATILRMVDHAIAFGRSSDEGTDDAWPALLEQIKKADILVLGVPVWSGNRSSMAQLVIERLGGTRQEADDETGQYPLYNTVAGVITIGREDGCHHAAAHTLFDLSRLGCLIPPNADCSWTAQDAHGRGYMESDGEHDPRTNITARLLAHNLVHAARLTRANPFLTNLKALRQAAWAYSGYDPEG